jgi:hypothetical protein
MTTQVFLSLIAAVSIVFEAAGDERAAAAWGPVSNNVQMSISLDGGDRQPKTNEPFQLVVRLRNLSTTNVWAFKSGAPTSDPYGGVLCLITSPSGRDVSPNKPDNSDSGEFINVAPSGVETFVFKLGSICKFEEIGTYRITAKKLVAIDKNKQWSVVSNPLLISVVSTNAAGTNNVSLSEKK